MPEPTPDPDGRDPGSPTLADRLRATPGLAGLVSEAERTWLTRAAADPNAGWHAFEDAFPTFWEFSNRPR